MAYRQHLPAPMRVLFAAVVIAVFVLAWAMHRNAPAQSADCVSTATGHDFHGRTLVTPNFARQNLRNANFRCATLIGAAFIHSDLTGADFTHATFKTQPGRVPQTDFSFANLTGAKFVQATFAAPTYFTYATLTSADFSHADISTVNAIFGDEPLLFDATAIPRPTFANTTMSCEFIDQWRELDLSNADLSACTTRLAGRNFSGTLMPGVSLAGVKLDGAQFAGADLSGAVLKGASLQCGPASDGSGTRCVDLSNAKLQGAVFDNANLGGASLYGAFLSNSDGGNAASLLQAHLKNVNLSAAHLSGVSFNRANFYGSRATNPRVCGTTGLNYAGFTQGCAAAHNADMAATNFAEAYLYGVDFTAATISGASFDQAVLAGANFAGANIGTFAPAAKRTAFTRAHLEGSNLDQAATLGADLTDAFVDFRSGGNRYFVLLDGANHNDFACSDPPTCKPPRGQPVCVWSSYPVTTVPETNPNITCPDGRSAAANGCGDGNGGNTRWKSSLDAGAPPPGTPATWYENAPSFGSATSDPAQRCNGVTPMARW
jgi:uncharacterized protein YjbI with pentapeptide repeats